MEARPLSVLASEPTEVKGEHLGVTSKALGASSSKQKQDEKDL